jgi:tetratricopeptide (TPR) repeat protein
MNRIKTKIKFFFVLIIFKLILNTAKSVSAIYKPAGIKSAIFTSAVLRALFIILIFFIAFLYMPAYTHAPRAFAFSINSGVTANNNNIAAASQNKVAILYKKAYNYFKSKQYVKSRQLLKFILNNYSLNKLNDANVYFLLGKIYFINKDFLIAKTYFQHIIFKEPDYTKIYSVVYFMAKCDFNLKNKRRSVRDFKFLVKKTEEKIKAGKRLDYMKRLHLKSLIYLGESYEKAGNIKNAVKILTTKKLRSILSKDVFLLTRGNSFNKIYLIYLINTKSDFKKALLVLNIKHLFKPHKKDLCYKNYFEGLIFLKSKQYVFASRDFSNSFKSCGKNYYYNLSMLKYGESLIGENKTNIILTGLKLINFESDNIDYPSIQLSALKYLFNYYFIVNNYNKSFNYISRMLFNFQNGLNNKKKYQKIASKLLYKIMKNNFLKHQYNKSLKIYKRRAFLLEKHNLTPDIYYILSKIYLKKGNTKQAIYYANKYYDRNNNIYSLYYLANVYYKAKDYKHSLKLANKIKLPIIKNKILFNKLLNLKIQDNKKLGLKKNMLKLLSENLNRLKGKQYVKTLYLVAMNDYNNGLIAQSLHYFSLLLNNELAKKEPSIINSGYYHSGIMCYKLKQFKSALRYFTKAYNMLPAGKHFQYELSQIGYIYLKNKNYKYALKYYKKLEKNGSSSFYKNLAKSMVQAIKLKS